MKKIKFMLSKNTATTNSHKTELYMYTIKTVQKIKGKAIVCKHIKLNYAKFKVMKTIYAKQPLQTKPEQNRSDNNKFVEKICNSFAFFYLVSKTRAITTAT